MSFVFASVSASSPHGYQFTGLLACCRRYGLDSVFRLFDIDMISVNKEMDFEE